MYVFGIADNSRSIEVYDPAANTWQHCTKAPSDTYDFLAIAGGMIYIFDTRKVHIYDIKNETWDEYPHGIQDPIGNLIYPGEGTMFYVMNGTHILSFDIETNTLTQIAQFPQAAINTSKRALVDDKIYCFPSSSQVFHVYDIPSQSWATENHEYGLTTTMYDCVGYQGNLILIYTLGTQNALMRVYDPLTKEWLNGPGLPGYTTRGCCAEVINNSIYVRSGQGNLYIFGDEAPGTTYTITTEYLDSQDVALRQSATHTVTEGQTYTTTAPTISGYNCLGYMIDGGDFQAGATATIDSVNENHTLVFVYKKDDGGTCPAPGIEPDGKSLGRCTPLLKLDVPLCKCNDAFIQALAEAIKTSPNDCCGCK